MQLAPRLLHVIVFVGAALFCVLGAVGGVTWVEGRTLSEVRRVLTLQGFDWVDVQVDGLIVALAGTAPNEATRFRALTTAGDAVDPERLRDEMAVAQARQLDPLRFSVEVLRNTDGISLIGLIPANTDRDTLVQSIEDLAQGAAVTDMLETANDPAPAGWDVALSYGLATLEKLPRAKISIQSDRVDVRAITSSPVEKRRLESDLSRTAPEGVQLALNISAPRPVITPFTLRFTLDGDGQARFDACSAHTTSGRDQILSAARAAGLTGQASCTLGLGVPSPRWPDAVSTAIAKLTDLGGGTVTFSDADVSLVALDTTPPSVFDRVVGELEADLPDAFSLDALLPEKVEIDGTGDREDVIEFVATRSPEGQVQLRGRLTTPRQQTVVTSYAKAQFGADEVYSATRLDSDLPDGWPLRVMAGLEALAQLNRGSLIVQPDFIELRGETGNAEAQNEMSRVLAARLGEAQNYRLNVSYVEALDPLAALPTPEECVARITGVLEGEKIAFAPGSANIEASSLPLITAMAAAFEDCEGVPFEIAGYTDSQGRESMNLNLSQARADAVLNSLQARKVLIGNLTAKGYGEADPIADNSTEEGREANRRIEIRAITTTSEETPNEQE